MNQKELMIETVQSILDGIQKRNSDERTQLCRLETVRITNKTLVLQGEVLDRETLAAVVAHLAAHLADVRLDPTSIRVLRQPTPCYLVVSSNITELYEGPSFGATRSSTLLNGTVAEVLKEEGRWVFVRLPDGYLGWVYRPYLEDFVPRNGPVATHMIRVPFRILRAQATDEATAVGRVFAGTYVVLETAESGWAEISLAGGATGYLPLADLVALETMPVESARRTQIGRDAFDYIGVPYLWGGGSVLGIDCSGFAQLLHRLAGVIIPRDADMQYAAGQPVEPPFQLGDLLFFGGKGSHRDVSHVGISLGSNYRLETGRLGDWAMIHASRSRNGVYVDDVADVESLRQIFVGARSFL